MSDGGSGESPNSITVTAHGEDRALGDEGSEVVNLVV